MFPELTQRLHGVTMQVLRRLPYVQCTVQCALCKIEIFFAVAVVCALQNIHLASVTIRYVFINWVVTLFLRPTTEWAHNRHQSRTVFQWLSSHIQTFFVGRGSNPNLLSKLLEILHTHPHSKNRTGTWLFIPGGLCTMTCKGMLRIARFSRSCSGFGKT